ncbi:MAG: APC family permease [Candidatus Riflebacteria bacterium]|nr:APC family permease [Candidatus Riflebacteria bacterium]
MNEAIDKTKNIEDGKLGLTECVFILIGGMVGSAIFSLSGLTILEAGPASLLTWSIAGIIMLFHGMLICELSCIYPQSGGVYVFPRKAFGGEKGRFLGWLSCWGSMVTNVIAIAFAAIYVGTYLSVAFKWAADYQIPLAIASIMICLVFNIIKFKTAGKLNNTIVGFLLVTILIYVFACFLSGKYEISGFSPFFAQGIKGFNGFISAIPIAIIGYSSINAMAFMVSDVKNPGKTVSKAMFISISVVIAIYLLVIGATLGLITSEFLIKNEGMRFIPLFAACFTKMQNMPWLVDVVSIASVIALMTTMNVCVSLNARTLQASSQDLMLPKFFGNNNRNGVPAFAALITSLFAMIVALFPKITLQIVNFGAIFNLFTIIITLISLIEARKTSESKQAAFKAPGGNALIILILLILIGCNITSIVTGGKDLFLFTIVFWVLGLSVYYCRALWVNKAQKGSES